MVKHILQPEGMERYEYDGGTVISLRRRIRGAGVLCDWLLFDSVEDAETFFNERCWAAEGGRC